MDGFSHNSCIQMKGWSQNEVNFVKSSLEQLSYFGEKSDNFSVNCKSEMERSIVAAYSKMKTLFSSNEKSMNLEPSSLCPKPFKPTEGISIGDFSSGFEAGPKLASLPFDQVKADVPKSQYPTAKANRYRRRWFYRPKKVFMERDNLIVSHALYSQIVEGGNFQFFHCASLAKVSVKIVKQSVPSSEVNPVNYGSNQSCDIDTDIESVVALEEMTMIQELVVKVQGLKQNEEVSNNFSCISVEKHQDLNSMTVQHFGDQSTPMVTLFTSNSVQKKKKQRFDRRNKKSASLLLPGTRPTIKTGKKKEIGRRMARKSIGSNGMKDVSPSFKMILPSKRAIQPIIFDFGFDPDLFQAFKRRKWLLGSS